MDKFENKIYQKYLKMIRKSTIKKYKKIASNQALEKRIYFDKQDCSKQLVELKKQIYHTLTPLMEDEITERLSNIIKSRNFEKAVSAERALSKKTLHYKALKKYQKLPIRIQDSFLDILYDEVNIGVGSEDIIKIEELRYLTLLVLYAIIECIKQGMIIKLGTIFKIWCDKRDFISNLPIDNKIRYNWMFPKLKLCNSFDGTLFRVINKDNEAITNYYKAKTERLLILLKIKRANDD